jgi:hypothetical protein
MEKTNTRKMSLLIAKILLPLFGCLLLLSVADRVGAAEHDPLNNTVGMLQLDDSRGYRDVVHFGKKFIAVGTAGRIDGISSSAEIIPVDFSCPFDLNCIFANDTLVIAAGDQGTILYSTDGVSFDHAESGTDKNIHSITSKDGLILAGSDTGLILGSNDGRSWNTLQTNAKGNVLSISANNSFFMGVTDAGEILKSGDSYSWHIQDYNKEYAGYNPYSNFKKILATPHSFVIIGTHQNGSPSILFSSLGHVWTERVPFYYDEQDMVCHLNGKPNDVTYDPMRDQFFLACDNGELFSLPTCTNCNKYTKISENNLNALFYADNSLCIVGEEFSLFVQRF